MDSVVRVLVTGAHGQLGQCLQKIEADYPKIQFLFTTKEELDITNKENLQKFFGKYNFDFVINCAAYTQVDQAEKEPKKAFLINAEAVKNVALVCKEHNTIMLHISTDYVFDGQKRTPYTEEDLPNPINVYGKSKLAGEKYIQETLEKYYIIRTSWLYSKFGHNFVKTILRLAETKKEFTVTTSEKGTPTNANDLARFILNIITNHNKQYGTYHYSNLGEATWYDFAKEIVKVSGKLDRVMLKKTDNYPTFASRPSYSVLDKEKCIQYFGCKILHWKESLKKLMKR